ncbi:E3 ubiquitin-protein ligase UPL1 [Vitis vinifera]|uniref:E3 ubiquitin-protein ligase UPL1 n=1 Tax=Vitis vinifera TaxID=29760 RepID=A0A438EQP3_VITVI|nr:E3 ubiquitin-protein ligase UPL1 [Vitis vinifera]
MIDGGMVQCLTSILEVIDLDHPDAPKISNLIVKSLESLTRAANNSDQVFKSDGLNKKKSTASNGRSDDQLIAPLAAETGGDNQNRSSQQELMDAAGTEQRQPQGISQSEGNHDANQDQSVEQEMRIEVEEAMTANPPMELGMDFMREEMDEGGVLHNTDQIEMTYHVENRADDDMGDEDDDMGMMERMMRMMMMGGRG